MVRRVLDQRRPATRVVADFGVSERTVRKVLAGAASCGASNPSIRRHGRALPTPAPRPADSHRHKIHIDARKRGRIVGIGHRITGRRLGVNRAHGFAGNTCTLQSMTARA
jgi:hypothetical protein